MTDLSRRISLFTLVGTVLSFGLTPFVSAADKTDALPNIAERVKTFEQQRSSAKEAPKITPQDKAVMAKAAQDLAAAMPNPGLTVGTKAPNFSLKNAEGKTVSLRSALKKGPVVLVFYRGAWCPYCNLQLHALKESLPAFEKQGASIIAITPQTPDKSLAQVKKDGYPFEILSDLDDQVIKAYKLYWEVTPELDATYKKSFGLDVQAFNGQGRRGLPVPGTFIIDQSGIVRAASADTNYKKRMEPADILAALEKLPRKK